MVTHWSQKDRLFLKKSRSSKSFGYPKHSWYSGVVCFASDCRRKAAWVKKQRNDRFKGFKDGGRVLPTTPRDRSKDSTVMLAKKTPPKKTAVISQQPAVQQPASPAIVTTAPVTQVVKSDSLIVLNEVLFAVNSYRLRPELYPKLDSIVLFLRSNPATKIEISGHTDSTGKESHNLNLSENRADAVAEYVVDKGIETSRVSFNGYGSSRPIAPNDTEEGRRKNRRVEILIHNRR
jgi:outer membrane protein OmpA-like peptidoglycan-associated protein